MPSTTETPAPPLSDVLVPILMGSARDASHGRRIGSSLTRFGVPWEMRVVSAHKSTARLLDMLADYTASGKQVIYITVAGRSNALSGVVDAQSLAPVIACPPSTPEQYAGLDVLSSLRMPGGIAPLVILDAEAAGLAVVKILALTRPALLARLAEVRHAAEEQALADDSALRGEEGDVA